MQRAPNGLCMICKTNYLNMVGWFLLIHCLLNWKDYVVMRVVVRQGFSRDMADMLLGDINNAIAELEKLEYPTPTRMAQEKESSGRSQDVQPRWSS